MDFNIFIPQKTFSDLGLIGKLDLVDAALAIVFADLFATQKMEVYEKDGVKLYWVSHSKIKEQLPLCALSEKGWKHHIDKLIKNGLLIVDAEFSRQMRKSLYAPSNLLREIYKKSRVNSPKSDKQSPKSDRVLTQKRERYSPKSDRDTLPNLIEDNSTNDNTTKDNTITDYIILTPTGEKVESVFIEPEKIPKSDSRFSDFEIIQPEEVQPPKMKVFDMPMDEREKFLMDLVVPTTNQDLIAWLFGMEHGIGGPNEVLLMRMSESDKKIFSEKVAKHVLFSSASNFVGTLKNYLWGKKYLDALVDSRPKPKLTKAEENMKKHFESIAETYQKIDQLKKNGNS